MYVPEKPVPQEPNVPLSSEHWNGAADTVSEKAKLAGPGADGSIGPDVIVGAGGTRIVHLYCVAVLVPAVVTTATANV